MRGHPSQLPQGSVLIVDTCNKAIMKAENMNDQLPRKTCPFPLALQRIVLGVIVVTGLIIIINSNRRSYAQPLDQSSWTLVWSDEFNGLANTGVDNHKWIYDTGTGYGCIGCPPNWGTGEIETMSNSTDNVYQDGVGHLAIKPIRNSTGDWTSGRIETQKTDFQPPDNGVLAVEASIQQPNVSGVEAAGYWPAFWMFGSPFRGNYLNWPNIGEIDIMEDVNGLNSEFATLHCGTNPDGPCNEPVGMGSGQRPCADCQTGFHTYRVELDMSVSPQQIRWYLDSVNFFTVNSNQVDPLTWNNATNHGFFIILDMAMGGNFPAAFGGGPTDSTVSGIPIFIDYVRVYIRPLNIFLPVVMKK
jgi:beta-glucanase (GH16 family)